MNLAENSQKGILNCGIGPKESAYWMAVAELFLISVAAQVFVRDSMLRRLLVYQHQNSEIKKEQEEEEEGEE
jgi:hypothetical protein